LPQPFLVAVVIREGLVKAPIVEIGAARQGRDRWEGHLDRRVGAAGGGQCWREFPHFSGSQIEVIAVVANGEAGVNRGIPEVALSLGVRSFSIGLDKATSGMPRL